MYHGEYDINGTIHSGTVPLPPLSKIASNRSTSSSNPQSLKLASTTQDPLGFSSSSSQSRVARSVRIEEEEGGRGVSPERTKLKWSNENPIPFTVERTKDPVSPSRVKIKSSKERMSLNGINWDETNSRRRSSNDSQVQGLSQERSSPSKPLQNRSSTLSYNTISTTASSRSSYSINRPSHPFQPSHTRDPSSSTSVPSSKSHSQTHLLDFPLPSTSKTVRIRNRTSSSLSLARTPSNTSSTSSTTNQTDSPITPARAREKGKGREMNEDWERGLPVLGPASPERKGMPMVDPRFSFPRRQNQNAGGRLGVIGPTGEVRRGSDESERMRSKEMRENSFIASLSSQPLLDRTGQILPLYSTSAPSQTTYLPTSPLQPSLLPPSPFSPTSPVHSIISPSPHQSSRFLPYPFTSSSPASSKPRSNSNPRSTSSFTQRIRQRSRSNPRKPVRRRRSSSLRSSRSSNSPPHREGRFRARSVSTPDLRTHARSQSVPIPFDQFSPRSPYAHDATERRRPSIADELLFGKHERRTRVVDDDGSISRSEVFPSFRRYSMSDKDKGKGREEVNVNTRSRSPPPPLPIVPSRSTQPRGVRTQKRRKDSLPPPKLGKGSLIKPHPKLLFSGNESESSSEGEEGIRRRYAAGGRDDEVERILTEESFERRERERDGDQESLDHSSLVRVLRENEESRKEREGWSDSANKSLGFGSISMGLGGSDKRRRGKGNIVLGGGRSGVREERKKVRKDVEREKKSRDSETETETFGRRRSSQGQVTNGCSPPMPSSFEPFVQLGKKLSLSRTRSREKLVKNKGSVGSGLYGVYTGEGSEGVGSTRTVRGKPIRHLRGSNSVDSIYSRTQTHHLPLISRMQEQDTDTQYGQALSFDDDVTHQPINEEHRRPSLTNQNAFLSLPPHLHHLLRSPERSSYEPSRAPPPPPAPASAISELRYPQDSNRFSTSSVASAARLSLALETQLLRTGTMQPTTLDPGTPTLSRTNARTPEITDSHFNRSVSTPALLCDASNRSTPDSPVITIKEEGEPTIVNDPIPSPAPMSDSLSPVPELESPESKRSTNSASTGSSGFNMDERGNWNELFFSPPRRQGASHKSGTSSFIDPTVSIMVASDDDSTDTDDTFSIRRLERTQRSLEALFTTSKDSENAQETLLAPSFLRTDTEMSSAQASFVTAQETASEVGGETEDEDGVLPEVTIDPRFPTSRPMATPAQTPWASTSFAREYLDTLDVDSNRSSALLPQAGDIERSLSRSSAHSFLDLADEERPNEPTTLPSISPSSFLDDFSPPSSSPSSPAIEQSPALFANTPSEPPSLPTSPTLSTTFDDSNRLSQIPTNRDSYLSVDSNNLHISPTAARFADNGGRTHSHTSSSSRSTVIGNFPIPPRISEEDPGSDGDDEGEEQEVQIPTSIDEGDDATLRLDPHSPHTPQRSPVYPSKHSPTRHVVPTEEANTSFLDVSDPSDNESKRWSHQTFQTFYSSPKKQTRLPPLPDSDS